MMTAKSELHEDFPLLPLRRPEHKNSQHMQFSEKYHAISDDNDFRKKY